VGGDLEAVLMRHPDDLAHPRLREIRLCVMEAEVPMRGGDS
jgi:hypothetical protein